MHHAVTYSIDFVQRFQHCGRAFGEALEDELHTCGMFGYRLIDLNLLAIEFYFDE